MLDRIIPPLVCLLVVSGCAVTSGTKNLSRDLVTQNITKGVTKKDDVFLLLGKPAHKMITESAGAFNMMPYETWSYTRIDQDHSITGTGFAVFALTGANYVPTTATTLVVMFDKDGIVQNYTFAESN